MSRATIFGSANPATTPGNDYSQGNYATAFYITSGTTWTAKGIRLWIDTASTPNTLDGYIGYLYSGSDLATATQVTGVNFPTIVKGAWNEALFNSPVNLAIGNIYWVVAYLPNGGYSYIAHRFDNALQSVEDNSLYGSETSSVTPGNGAFHYGIAGDVASAQAFNNNWYGVDVIADNGASMAIPQNLDLDASRQAYYTATVGANNLDADALYNKFLRIKTGLTGSTLDMALVYWRNLAGLPNGSIQDCQSKMFNPYQQEELYYLRAQP